MNIAFSALGHRVEIKKMPSVNEMCRAYIQAVTKPIWTQMSRGTEKTNVLDFSKGSIEAHMVKDKRGRVAIKVRAVEKKEPSQA